DEVRASDQHEDREGARDHGAPGAAAGGRRNHRLSRIAAHAARASQRGDRMIAQMSAIGPKRTSTTAPHMSAFGGKADMTFCGCLLSRSLSGVKRTSLFAAHMSAYDPKRTSVGLRPTPSRVFAQIATITCLSLGGDYEATRLHQGCLFNGCVAACGACTAILHSSDWFYRRGVI